MKVCLNYHNLGYNPQFGINKVHPAIFKNHVDICNDLSKDVDITITFDDGYEVYLLLLERYLMNHR